MLEDCIFSANWFTVLSVDTLRLLVVNSTFTGSKFQDSHVLQESPLQSSISKHSNTSRIFKPDSDQMKKIMQDERFSLVSIDHSRDFKSEAFFNNDDVRFGPLVGAAEVFKRWRMIDSDANIILDSKFANITSDRFYYSLMKASQSGLMTMGIAVTNATPLVFESEQESNHWVEKCSFDLIGNQAVYA